MGIFGNWGDREVSAGMKKIGRTAGVRWGGLLLVPLYHTARDQLGMIGAANGGRGGEIFNGGVEGLWKIIRVNCV